MSYNEIFGIKQFYTQVQLASGFARDMQLRVTQFVVNGINAIEPQDLIFLRTADIPGKTINVQTVGFMGVNLQIPGSVSFTNPWNVNFYCTQNYNIRRLLELSMEDTFNHRASVGDIEPRELEKYKIQFALLDDKMAPLREYTLYGAFVSSIENMAYDATGSGAIKQLGASISYQFWEAYNAPDAQLSPIAQLKRDGSPNKYTNIQAVLNSS